VDESMRKRQDTKLSKDVEELKFEIFAKDFLIYETTVRRRVV
jgi:hypothetical protein